MNDFHSDTLYQSIQQSKRQLIELLNSIVYIHYVNFKQTEIYSKIANLTRTFNYTEQNLLEKEIYTCFKDFIYNLSHLCPKITRIETVICCLSFHLTMKKISLCLGYVSTDTIRQHKFRIKNKMTVNSDNAFLFDFIFSGLKQR